MFSSASRLIIMNGYRCQLTRSTMIGYCTKSRTLPKLTLFSKSGDCSLCDDMKEALQPYLNYFEYEEIDISLDENAFWGSRYKYEIPVVHLNGKMLMKHWFDEDKMKSALDGLDKL